MNDGNCRGIWGRVASAGEPRSKLAAQLIRELDEGLEVLDTIEAAMLAGSRQTISPKELAPKTGRGE